MYQYGYRRGAISQLFRLVDWMMALPTALEPAFERAMMAIEQEHKMAFVTSIERLGEKARAGKRLGKRAARGRGDLATAPACA